jgi:hypothetical protein
LHTFLGASDDSWDYLAGQYYYNAGSQKIRIDSTVPGGFLSSYSYYVYVRSFSPRPATPHARTHARTELDVADLTPDPFPGE